MRVKGREKVPVPSSPGPRFSATLNLGRDQVLRGEIEGLKEDIREKEVKMRAIRPDAESLKEVMQMLKKLIDDLSQTAEKDLLGRDLRDSFESMLPQQIVPIIRAGIRTLLQFHSSMSQRFEQLFAEKVQELLGEISEVDAALSDVVSNKKEIEFENARLDQLSKMHVAEKESLLSIVRKMDEDIAKVEYDVIIQSNAVSAEIERVMKESGDIRAQSALKERRISDLRRTAVSPFCRAVREDMKQDFDLHREIERLTALLERETAEHALTREELIHTEREIEKGEKIRQKYVRSHSGQEKWRTEKVNSDLRAHIELQRDEYNWMIKNQIKKNREMEKQKRELDEEVAMLTHYLGLLEKKLASEMVKLPNLARLQHRGESEIGMRKNVTFKMKKREPDDAEMRTVKRTLSQLQKNRKRLV
jgi:hypothetical protein